MKSGQILYVSVLIGIILLGLPSHSIAETLNDASIRALYAEDDALSDNMQKHRQFLEKHLDDAFILTQNISETDNGEKPETHIEKSNKQETIKTFVDVDSMTKNVKDSGNTITDIKYSDDHSYAIVTYTNTETGILADPNSQRHAHYQSAQSCVERVQVVKGVLKMMQANCNEQASINEE